MSATSEKVEFKPVLQISSPGKYIFASDMINRGGTLLPECHEMPSDNVFGARPQWETTLPKYLRTRYPGIQETVYDQINGISVRSERIWNGNVGHIRLGIEHYRYFQGLAGETGTDQQSIGIYGTPKLVGHMLEADLNYQARTLHDPDGELELKLVGSGNRALDEKGLYWRGTLLLDKQLWGKVIIAALDHINESIAENKIPVWKVVNVV